MKKQMLSFLDEMEKNLELFYVMDQRQFILGGFHDKAALAVESLESVKKHESIRVYLAAIRDFNNSFAAYKEYEQWYASDTQNKTQENAKKLHASKHALDNKLKTLEAIIIYAGQDLERELLQLGYISQ